MDNTSKNNDFQVLMNPNLSNTLSKLENKINVLDSSIQVINNNLTKILETSTNIESILQENKKIYISLMKQNQQLSQKNLEVLKDNRKVYCDALDKLDMGEVEVKDLLERLENNNKKLAGNIVHPISESRVYNRYWRSSGINTVMKPLDNDLITKLNISNNK
jgi:hypothetical protein